MSPNPMVAMPAPAPDTRYAPREMPRPGGRSEGRSFEERLNMAEAKPRSESASRGAAQAKPQEKPEVAKESAPEAAPKSEPTSEEQVAKASEPDAETAVAAAPVSVPVSDLASVAVMKGLAPAPEAEAAPVTESVAAAQAVAAEAASGEAVTDPALTAAVVKAVAPQAKQEAETKVETEAKPAEPEEASEGDAQEVAKAPVPVKPVARQSVPSSLDGLHAVKGLTSLRESLDGAPRTETTPAPARTEAQAVPAHLDEVRATVLDSTEAPEAPAVKPWEITESVRVAPEAPKSEVAAVKAEPVPVKEAITRTFLQVQKTPDRPAELRLQLNPEHLGRMEVRVQAHEGAVSAVIRVEHGAVRDLVESQFAALRTSLAEQGIKIDRLEVSVNQQGPRDQQAAAGFEFGRQSFGQGGQQESSGQSQQGASRQSSWDAWGLEGSEDMPVAEAIAMSGFDAQA